MEMMIGKSGKGKQNYLAKRINNAQVPTIILDFKDKFDHLDGKRIDLGVINPYLSYLNWDDLKMINAGVLEYQTVLQERAKDVLKTVTPPDQNWETYKYDNLIQETIQRSINGWSKNENLIIGSIYKHLQFKKNKQIHSIEETIAALKNENTIIFKNDDLNSIETRLLLFLLLPRYYTAYGKFLLVSDHLNNIWKNGYVTNFFREFDINKIDSLFGFHTSEQIPKRFFETTTDFTIFKLDNNKDYLNLKKKGIDITEVSKRLKDDEFIQIKTDMIKH